MTVERKRLPISQLRFASSLPALCDEQFTKDLAASIDDVGVIHLPRVRQGSNEIVCGEHRIAAQHINGEESVDVEVVPLTDEEAETQRLAENLFRREVDRTTGLARYADLVARRKGGELPPADDSITPVMEKKRGRKKTERGVAREQAARELGTTPEAIRQAEYRKRKSDEKPAQEPTAGCLETFGTPVPAEVEVVARRAQEQIDEADGHLRALSKCLTELERQGFRQSVLRQLQELRGRLAHEVRRARPRSQCPYCKNVPAVQAKCAACDGSGYALRSQLDDVSPELKSAEVVVVDGRQVTDGGPSSICLACAEARPAVANACSGQCETAKRWKLDPDGVHLDEKLRAAAEHLGLVKPQKKSRRVHIQDESGKELP